MKIRSSIRHLLWSHINSWVSSCHCNIELCFINLVYLFRNIAHQFTDKWFAPLQIRAKWGSMVMRKINHWISTYVVDGRASTILAKEIRVLGVVFLLLWGENIYISCLVFPLLNPFSFLLRVIPFKIVSERGWDPQVQS